ncbi:hypothetical protein C0J52_04697 [Blattella germanica]|nr:hypothetical protein C0J52_04697 [Blattella germanica]
MVVIEIVKILIIDLIIPNHILQPMRLWNDIYQMSRCQAITCSYPVCVCVFVDGRGWNLLVKKLKKNQEGPPPPKKRREICKSVNG